MLRRILLDHCVDRRFARFIDEHEVVTTRRMGWEELKNGALLTAAEANGFEALLTVDKNLRYQQSLLGRTIAVVTLDSLYVDALSLAPLVPALKEVLLRLEPGQFVVVRSPD